MKRYGVLFSLIIVGSMAAMHDDGRMKARVMRREHTPLVTPEEYIELYGEALQARTDRSSEEHNKLVLKWFIHNMPQQGSLPAGWHQEK